MKTITKIIAPAVHEPFGTLKVLGLDMQVTLKPLCLS